MRCFKLVLIFLIVHVVVVLSVVVLVRTHQGHSAANVVLAHLQAGGIAAVWHLPLTAFVYRFVGEDLAASLRR